MKDNPSRPLYLVPYYIWIALFVIAPIALIFYFSFLDLTGAFTLENYQNFFSSVYLRMT
ncbi:MAG: ABC transporter permease, partial [Planococcus sp. (in: Bacteria)]|nr:ABC transporter permease [Planococcus sp. (in: firmicutes)]